MQAAKVDPEVEVCGSLREARMIGQENEAGVGFEPTTNRVANYRDQSWTISELFEKYGLSAGLFAAKFGLARQGDRHTVGPCARCPGYPCSG